MAHVARRQPPPRLPDSPPVLHLDQPPLSLAGSFNSQLPARQRFRIGDPRFPAGTARHILLNTYARDGRQTLAYMARKWLAWSDAEHTWGEMPEEAVEAFLWRALADNGWQASPKHVAALLKVLKLALYYPAPEMRCAA